MNFDPQTPPQGTLRDWIDQRAETAGAAPTYHFFDGQPALSWSDLRDAARQGAQGLTGLGIAKGESVAVIMPNGRASILALYGILYGGFRATMINLAAGDEAISYALEHSEARFALVDPDQMPLFNRCAAPSVQAMAEIPPADTALHDVTPNDHALLMYTSGTTGRPKGVVHSQSSLLAGGWTTALAHQLGPEDTGFCVLPIYHINGLCVTVMGGLVSGGAIAVAPKFSASAFWGQIAETRATWFSVVPTIISHLLAGEADPDAESRARLRFGRSASSALPVDVHRAFESRFDVAIVETMGLTETAAQILSNPLPGGKRKIGSPGIAYGNEACILSPDLKPLGPNVQGEIAVRGPNVMVEYLKNPDANAATFTPDGWLRTGDLGHVDADGYVYVTGRLKELIIKGGENIAPREVDEALYSHPDVIEAAAFARPCKSYGERVEAAVAIRAGSALTPQELSKICEDKLGRFKSPDHIHVMDELPKGPSGKIQRLKLAEILREVQA